MLDGTAAWFECSVHNRIDAGDHIILLGAVQSYGHEPLSPLGFCRGSYLSLQLDQDIIAARTQAISRSATTARAC